MFSSSRALYSTPSMFGTVISRVSASRTAASLASSSASASGSPDVALAEPGAHALEDADLVLVGPLAAEVLAVEVGDDRQHAAAHRHPRLALPAGLGPGGAEAGDLLGLQLVERARRCPRPAASSSSGSCPAAPSTRPSPGCPTPTRSGRPGPATAAGSPAGRRRRRSSAGRRRPRSAPRRRGEEQRRLVPGEVGVAAALGRHVAERLRAAQRRLR